ncbi:MAG: pyuvate ferredoxin oxidoreductase subunit delta [Candidatus Syntrophoarchaeum caldarius]|uniref:Pyuvate ferredoxin oxidoreductase subunit delta n=1 Tax=Candidatus Syntropharchaeum caldarium TaxID=1838285 RepID=A0A1F2PCN0_9EURY|nr:MAG: pyuvate ferredoxin oxidoreductase subunit delta [Candidatus Syntrophoarchaeum caldarius]
MKLRIGAIADPGTSVVNLTGGWRTEAPRIEQTLCIRCFNCVIYCPESAVHYSEERGIEFDYDYCKGCGICANECSGRAIYMEMEEK